LPIWIFVAALTVPVCLTAQDDASPSLGDIARSFRKEKKTFERTIIDNENLDQLMDEIQNKKFSRGSMLFSFANSAKSFKVSSPDVTCSLSFSGKASSLLSDPFMPREVPSTELVKLDGPAAIQGNTLEVTVYNGSAWNIRELTVGVTILRPTAKPFGPPMLKPAAETIIESSEKRSDQTFLYQFKGAAAPLSTTVFTTDLTEGLGPDQQWHWAIVSAKGILAEPPVPEVPPIEPTLPASAPTEEPVPATSSSNPHP
jgi:hypothetical protein